MRWVRARTGVGSGASSRRAACVATTVVSDWLPPILVLAGLLPIVGAFEGDAAIYFVFVRQFGQLPFSFQPGQVSFGASSPLHVVLLAPIYGLAGASWLLFAKVTCFGLLALGSEVLARAVGGGQRMRMFMALFTLANAPLLIYTSRLFETGLAYLAVAFVYFCLRRGHWRLSAMVGGSLHLVRPELVLLSGGVYLYGLRRSRRRLRHLALAVVSISPVLAYYAYMGLMTGGLIPSSVYGRWITAVEGGLRWHEAFVSSFARFLLADFGNIIYPIGIVGLVVAIRRLGVHALRIEIGILTLIVTPFMLSPPLDYTPRYLVPATAILAASTGRWVASLRAERTFRAVAVVIAGTALLLVPYLLRVPRFDTSRLLLIDLTARLNQIATPDDRVLLYEIQGQYGLAASAYSLDGIVGGQTLPFLLKRQTLAELVMTQRISYIVTHDAFAYRKIYADTPLVDLYRHDLGNGVGARLEINGVVFEKVLESPDFGNPERFRLRPWSGLNFGEHLRVYNAPSSPWDGTFLMWNSLYRVSLADDQGASNR
jgi:hypothetical protein